MLVFVIIFLYNVLVLFGSSAVSNLNRSQSLSCNLNDPPNKTEI